MSRVVDLEAMGQNLKESLRKDFPLVRRTVLEEGSDSTGDDALFVWVLLDDSVRDEDLSWSAIKPLTERAEELARAISLGWPYARVRREREWDERNLSEEEIAEAEAG